MNEQTTAVPNKERIKVWVDALRSGKYRQTGGRLRRRDEFCCLGVGCDVSNLGVWREHDTYEVSPDDVGGGFMPNAVVEYYGLSTDESDYGSPRIYYAKDGVRTSLVGLNDDKRLSFPEIADVIEANFLQEEAAQ